MFFFLLCYILKPILELWLHKVYQNYFHPTILNQFEFPNFTVLLFVLLTIFFGFWFM